MEVRTTTLTDDPPPKRECSTCAFGADEFGRFNYHCRRHAPIAVLTEYGAQKLWPQVAMTDFCGDFTPKGQR